MNPAFSHRSLWAWANKNKPGADGKAAAEYAAADPGGKLPARVKKKRSVRDDVAAAYDKVAKR